MIIDYNKKYDEDIKQLLLELQEHITTIDKEKYSVITKNYKSEYFKSTMDEIEKYRGKMFLLQENSEIIGLIVGLINNEEINNYDFKAPKRGRITELVVSKQYRNKGYGKLLLNKMEEYLKRQGCKDILLGVFAYNTAIKFYEKNGYHQRTIEMTKTNI